MTKKFWIILAGLAVLFLIGRGISAIDKARNTCCIEDCNEKRYQNTVYCQRHFESDVRSRYQRNPDGVFTDLEWQYIKRTDWRPYCIAMGCHSKAMTMDSYYCREHICEVLTCEEGAVSGGKFCEDHTCANAKCYNMVSNSGDLCATCYKNKQDYEKIIQHDKERDKKHNSEEEWPDCDDYWDEEDFLDDWDGRIPDGGDAEDYWDNW